MTESRTELLGWLNDLLQLNYTRIEQCGTGAAFCQIADSIYGSIDYFFDYSLRISLIRKREHVKAGNVPITRVKFNSATEYDYINNFKILQSVFNKHKIERSVPIDKLVKCRYSDNLEFLQWMKKYWDAFYPGGRYDAAARRAIATKPRTPGSAKAPGAPTTPTGRSPIKPNMAGGGGRDSRTESNYNGPPKLRALSFSSTESGSSYGALHKGSSTAMVTPQQQQSRITSTANMLKSTTKLNSTTSPVPQPQTSPSNQAQQQERYINDLTRQVNDLKIAANTLERERNFYYLKLRDLEVLVLDKLESDEQVSFLHEIQTILYATEEGFIRPNKNNPPKLALAPIPVATIAAAPQASNNTTTSNSNINSINVIRRQSVQSKHATVIVPTITPNTAPVTYAMSNEPGAEVSRRSSLAKFAASIVTNAPPMRFEETQGGNTSDAAHSADTEVGSPELGEAVVVGDAPKTRKPSATKIPSRPGSAGVVKSQQSRSGSVVNATRSGVKTPTRPGSASGAKSPVAAGSRKQSVTGGGKGTPVKRNSQGPMRDSVPKQTASRPMSAKMTEPPMLPKSGRSSLVEQLRTADSTSVSASIEFKTSGSGAGE
ncbi:UNVERIFIED_CONTAM: hypothetical protein HDU68_006186 [Siphonaria sp. JEL0065]|nr:hypothetical protein HDU68_006186 [Siphonaria sp. JEL0065]